jgi:hypothetical protein
LALWAALDARLLLAPLALALALITAVAAPARADDPPPPNKSGFTLFNPTPDADLRSFSTDRPPKANGPYTVDAGRFQYETDVAVYSEAVIGGVKTEGWTLFDPTLKVGLTSTTDFELQVTPYQSVRTSGAVGGGTISGVGDTYAKIKFNLLGDDRGDLALALMPYVKIPTARTGLGNGDVEGGLVAPVSLNAPKGFVVVVMPQFDWLKDSSGGGYHGAVDFLVNVSHPLDKLWTLYTEMFTTQSFQMHDKPVYTFDTGLAYLLTPTVQLDFGSNLSLNKTTPQTQVYTGVSQRF